MTESPTLLRGELGQEPFRNYKKVVVARLRYSELSKTEGFFPDAVAVSVRVGEETEQFIVPYRIVEEDAGTVAASLMGEREGRILVSFPPTSFGQSKFSATYEDLAHITVSSFYWKK